MDHFYRAERVHIQGCMRATNQSENSEMVTVLPLDGPLPRRK
jgi:hypothetical protein